MESLEKFLNIIRWLNEISYYDMSIMVTMYSFKRNICMICEKSMQCDV